LKSRIPPAISSVPATDHAAVWQPASPPPRQTGQRPIPLSGSLPFHQTAMADPLPAMAVFYFPDIRRLVILVVFAQAWRKHGVRYIRWNARDSVGHTDLFSVS